MKTKLYFIGIASILLLTGFIYLDWYKYTSSSGHYTISFPAKPEESTDKQTTSDGAPFDIYYATYAPSDSEIYMVGYIDMTSFYPADKTIKEMLENSRDGATGSMETTSVTTIKTNLEGEPYIEFTFTAPKFTGKDKIYIINKYQYSIITIFSRGHGIGKDADKFIASFNHFD